MTSAAPQEITNELTDALNELASNPNRTEMDIRRISSRAEGLKRVAANEYYMIRGIIASLDADGSAVHDWFQKALNATPGVDPLIYRNYAVSLCEVGLLEEAGKVLVDVLPVLKNDIEFLHGAREAAIQIGSAEAIRMIEARLYELDQEVERDGMWSRFFNSIEEAGLDPAVAGQIIGKSTALLTRKSGARPMISTSFSVPDGKRTKLSLGYQITASVAEAREFEIEMLEQIYDMVGAAEKDRQPGDQSVLDWVETYVLRGTRTHAAGQVFVD